MEDCRRENCVNCYQKYIKIRAKKAEEREREREREREIHDRGGIKIDSFKPKMS